MMSETLSRVQFIASLAARGNAIQFGSDGGSLRLDIPASDADALLLVQKYFRNKAFKVTFEPADKQQGIASGNSGKLETGTERKSEWSS